MGYIEALSELHKLNKFLILALVGILIQVFIKLISIAIESSGARLESFSFPNSQNNSDIEHCYWCCCAPVVPIIVNKYYRRGFKC